MNGDKRQTLIYVCYKKLETILNFTARRAVSKAKPRWKKLPAQFVQTNSARDENVAETESFQVLFVNSNVSVIPRFHTSVLKTSWCPAVSRNTTSWERLISFVYGAMTSRSVLLTICYVGNRVEEDEVGGTILKRTLNKLDGNASTGYFRLSYEKVTGFCATVGVRTARKTFCGSLRETRHCVGLYAQRRV